MHIVLVTHHYLPEVGAPQRRWRELVARFVAAGHRVTVLAPPPHYPLGRAEQLAPEERPRATSHGPGGETIHRVRFREHGPDLPSRSADQLMTALDSILVGARRLRGRNRPDVLIATAPGVPSIAAGFLLARCRPRRVPLVVEMRDAWPDLIAPSGMWGTRRRGWRATAIRGAHRLVTAAQRNSAAVVTTTASFAGVLRTRRVRRVDVVRNGAPLDEAPHAAPVPDRDALHVLYLGTIGRSQGLGTAVRAASILTRRGVPVVLRLVGSGFDEDALREEAESLGAPVEFHGRVPRSEVDEQYRWADTVLVSLRAWDPFEWTVPSKLYEAMVAGRHVSASLTGEAALVLREAGAGDVVPPENAQELAALWAGLADDRSRLDVGDRGRRWVAEHANFDRLAEHYLTILDEVVA